MNVLVYHIKNFRNITYVKINGRAEVYHAISQLHNENHQWYCETGHPFRGHGSLNLWMSALVTHFVFGLVW